MVSNALDGDSVILDPEQTDVAPVALTVVGTADSVTTIALLTADVQPVTVFLILKENVPA